MDDLDLITSMNTSRDSVIMYAPPSANQDISEELATDVSQMTPNNGSHDVILLPNYVY